MSEQDKWDEIGSDLTDRHGGNVGTARAIAAKLRELGTQLDVANAEVDRLQKELMVIGDMAATDWNDAVVGAVDAAVPKPPTTYAERRRAELAQAGQLKAEIERLKALDRETAKAYNSNLLELGYQRDEIAQLKRGEYICTKCGLRKDGEGERGDF